MKVGINEMEKACRDRSMAVAVSVIVPVYHGKQYIKQMIWQIELCSPNIASAVELLLVNDDPKAPIEPDLHSDKIKIRVLNTECNCGIHGARVKGLEKAEGEFVLFLDQDDRIAADFIEKQLLVIGQADAAVCGALQAQAPFYGSKKSLQKCVRLKYMVEMGNGILSPGQVLIRKEAIPDYWKNHILQYNGADDWFLWLCMLLSGKEFICNKENLFEHTVHAENTSASDFLMVQSMREVYGKLRKSSLCTDAELHAISYVVAQHETNCMKERDKFLELYFLMDDWMTIREKGRSVSDYLQEQGQRTVAIYGKGRIGMRLAKELQAYQIEVSCFIDRNAERMTDTDGILTILPEEVGKLKEPVVITLARSEASVVGYGLKEQGITQVYLLSEIIQALNKQ